jgi:hypothetical protein
VAGRKPGGTITMKSKLQIEEEEEDEDDWQGRPPTSLEKA